MIKWLVETFLKNHINELVDRRFKEQMFERYYAKKANDLHERIQKLRQSIDVTQTQRISKNKPAAVLSSAVLEVPRRAEPELPTETNEAKLEVQQRNAELDAMRAKLMGKKK